MTSCTCGALDRMTAEPTCPVEFDDETNEFAIVTHGADGGWASWVIRYCPLCGGAAPETRRATLFAEITSEERTRLGALVGDLDSLDAVMARFGPPDHDLPSGFVSSTAATDTEPPVSSVHRVIRYTKLSPTADVSFTDFGARGIGRNFQGKYLGRPKA